MMGGPLFFSENRRQNGTTARQLPEKSPKIDNFHFLSAGQAINRFGSKMAKINSKMEIPCRLDFYY